MARKGKRGDTAYNARRRYIRAAERAYKQAQKEVGSAAARKEYIARENLQKAYETYDPTTKQKPSVQMRDLADKLGFNLEAVRLRDADLNEADLNKRKAKAENAIATSVDVKVQGMSAEALRQREAQTVFSNPQLSSRIIGGLESIWNRPVDEGGARVTDSVGNSVLDRSRIIPAIMNYFEVDNMADLLDKLDEVTDGMLYEPERGGDIYTTVTLLLQEFSIS